MELARANLTRELEARHPVARAHTLGCGTLLKRGAEASGAIKWVFGSRGARRSCLVASAAGWSLLGVCERANRDDHLISCVRRWGGIGSSVTVGELDVERAGRVRSNAFHHAPRL